MGRINPIFIPILVTQQFNFGVVVSSGFLPITSGIVSFYPGFV